MKYFVNCKSMDDAKKIYRDYLKKHHPDHGGDEKICKAIIAEFEQFIKSFVENIFNRGPYPTGGSESVIQKTCWSAAKPYEVICIPALRQVIDLGDLGKSRMIHSLGQSGHPGHRYYDHFVDPWRFFEHHPSNWERADIEAGEHDLLRLEPGG